MLLGKAMQGKTREYNFISHLAFFLETFVKKYKSAIANDAVLQLRSTYKTALCVYIKKSSIYTTLIKMQKSLQILLFQEA